MVSKIFSNKKTTILLCGSILVTGLLIAFIAASKNDVAASKTSIAPNVPLPTPSVVVKVASYSSPEGHKCYQYSVENSSSTPIVGVDVGVDPDSDETELGTLPRGWSVDAAEGGAIHDVNVASMVDAFTAEGSDKFYVSTRAFRANSGETRGFSVCMPGNWDNTYKTAHWKSYFMDGTSTTGQLIDIGSL